MKVKEKGPQKQDYHDSRFSSFFDKKGAEKCDSAWDDFEVV